MFAEYNIKIASLNFYSRKYYITLVEWETNLLLKVSQFTQKDKLVNQLSK